MLRMDAGGEREKDSPSMHVKLPASMRTPAYVLDVAALKRNLATVARIRRTVS